MPRVPLPTTDEHGVGKEPSQAEVIRRTGVASASANAVLVTLAAGEDDRLNKNNSPSPKGRRRILITNQSLPQHPQERHPTTTATGIVPTGGLSSWAQEGYRRVRSDQVQRKMHWLTGMAAIGGFLFGYDT